MSNVLNLAVKIQRVALKFTLLSPCLTLSDFDLLLEKFKHGALALINTK